MVGKGTKETAERRGTKEMIEDETKDATFEVAKGKERNASAEK